MQMAGLMMLERGRIKRGTNDQQSYKSKLHCFEVVVVALTI